MAIVTHVKCDLPDCGMQTIEGTEEHWINVSSLVTDPSFTGVSGAMLVSSPMQLYCSIECAQEDTRRRESLASSGRLRIHRSGSDAHGSVRS